MTPQAVDTLGRPLVFVQRCDSKSRTWWEVVDRRLPAGQQRIVREFDDEHEARAYATERGEVK